MESTRKLCFLTTLLLFLLLASVVHGAEFANAADAAADGGERATVRTGATGHAGHGYSSSHSGTHPNGGTPEQGGTGTGVVDPRNLDARGHRRNGAASRVIGNSSLVVRALLGALIMVVLA